MSKKTVLLDDPLWKSASELAEYSYTFADSQAVERHPHILNHFYDNGFELTNELAEAAGCLDPKDVAYYLGHARRELFALKNAFVMAKRLHGVRLEPEKMLQLDDLAAAIDARIAESEAMVVDELEKVKAER